MFTLAMEAKKTRDMGVVGSTSNILDFIASKVKCALDKPFADKLQVSDMPGAHTGECTYSKAVDTAARSSKAVTALVCASVQLARNRRGVSTKVGCRATLVHVGVVSMSQSPAKVGVFDAAAAYEVDLGHSRLQRLLLITCFAGAVCAGDRVRHDHQHCAQGARHAERVRP